MHPGQIIGQSMQIEYFPSVANEMQRTASLTVLWCFAVVGTRLMCICLGSPQK